MTFVKRPYDIEERLVRFSAEEMLHSKALPGVTLADIFVIS